MKPSRYTTTLFLALCLSSVPAFAESKPTPAPTQPVAQAAAGAVSGASAKSKAVQSNTQRTEVGDISAGSGNTYVLPAPALTVVPSSNGTVLTNSHAVNLLVLSWSKSEQTVAPDSVTKELIAEYERLCQFETASMLRQRRYALADPAYRELPRQPGVANLTREQCVNLQD